MRKIQNIREYVEQLYTKQSPTDFRWDPDETLTSLQIQQIYNTIRGYCYRCGHKLVPIGNRRKNGKPHNDWDTRKLHKCCWVKVKFKGGEPEYLETNFNDQ